MKPVRTRFAPSPTGALHLGAIRSALFAWLLAAQSKGTFILRIEDTDQTREVEGSTEIIKESLRWLGLNWQEGPDVGGDFGPYTQSERLDIYRKYSDILLESGAAYRCWCTPERLDGLRKEAQVKKIAFKYDRYCLEHPGDANQPHVVRIKIPDIGTLEFNDAVKGALAVQTDDLDDFVGLKSDSFPTYHLASVVDDHLMQITHVVRSDEWLASLPKHILLYQAFGWELPIFAHLPTVLGTDGRAKLSKRRGAKPALDYKKAGYLPDAVINFLATLGWNDGTEQETYTVAEIVQKFSLDRVQKAGAVFDEQRLLWMNGYHIRQLHSDELYKRVEDFWPKAAKDADESYKKQILGLVQERLKFFAELPELTEFFFAEPTISGDLFESNKQLKKLSPEERQSMIQATVVTLEQSDFSESDLEQRLRTLVEELDTKTGLLFGLIRAVITGSNVAPGLFETLQVLGKETSLQRLKKFYQE